MVTYVLKKFDDPQALAARNTATLRNPELGLVRPSYALLVEGTPVAAGTKEELFSLFCIIPKPSS
jgi:hypothetical protein